MARDPKKNDKEDLDDDESRFFIDGSAPQDDDLAPGDVTGGARVNPFEDSDAVYEVEEGPPVISKLGLAGAAWVFALFMAFQAWQLSSWNAREGRPPAWDQAIQLETTLDLHRALKAGDWNGIFFARPKPGMPPFPPAYHLSILYAMGSENPVAAARWANLFYLALLLVSVFGMTYRLTGIWPAAAAVLMLGCVPEIQWLLRDHLVDLALTAWVAAAYWALIESDRFNWRRSSWVFGLCFGMAMMTKWSAWTYFLPLFWWGMEATNENLRAKNLVLALLAAGLVAAPWYAVQWSVVLPRLFQATADNSVSVVKLSGLFSYFGQSLIGLETPLFIFCCLALGRVSGVKRLRKDAEPFLAWFILSFVFWTIVPNRQLRYLLPGLIPLFPLIAMTGKPRGLIAMSAYMLLACANYSQGWISPIAPRLGFTFSFFRVDLPKNEAWPIAEILRHADSIRDSSMPFSNLTLLANHPSFNGATFNWEVDRQGLAGISMRGVNKRVCEFSEFLLTKTDSLGPTTVINQLDDVRQKLMLERGWFKRGYAEVKRWDLPDKSMAVLYQRRKMPNPLLPKGSTARFDYFEEEGLTIQGARVELGSFDYQRGLYPKVRIVAEKIVLRGLEVSGVVVELEDLNFVTVQDMGAVDDSRRDSLLLDARLLGLRRLSILSAAVDENALEAFMKARVPGMRAVQVKIADGLAARANVRGLKLAAAAEAELGPNALKITLRALSVAGVKVPTILLGPNRSYRLSLEPDPELPFTLHIPKLSLSAGTLKVG